MAAAKKCDRCGNYFDRDATFYKYYEYRSGARVLKFKVIGRISEDSNSSDEYDLCPDCYKKLYKFLTGKEPIECK